MKILFFTEISPFPINGGEKIRSYGLLKSLSLLEYHVTAVFQNADNVNIDEYKLTNVDFIIYKDLKESSLNRVFQLNFFLPNKNVIEIFDSQLKTNKPDIVILDFFKAGKYSSYFYKNKIPVIVGTHNIESKMILQRPSRTIKNFFGKIRDYIYLILHERFIFRKASCLIAVSDLDKKYYEKILPGVDIHMIPNFLVESRYRVPIGKKEDYIIMTANFSAYMNYEGLRWFINKVWDKELDKKTILHLVGKHSEKVGREFIGSYRNIKLIGEVDDIVPYISKAKAVVIPLLHGSGTRLKCLEAMALKTTIIATSKGREGIDSNNIITVDSAEAFKQEILKATPLHNEYLFQDFEKKYSLTVNLDKMNRLLNKAISKN